MDSTLRSLLEREAIVSTTLRFASALDERDWPAVRACLAVDIDTDYSSFRGTPPARMTGDEFVRLRQVGLAGLVTQHLSLGHLVEVGGENASCRCEFVIRRWPVDTTDDRSLHSYGYYVFRLERADGLWRIAGITQVVRRSEGDLYLHGALRPQAG